MESNVYKTSAEWIKEFDFEIINPDGWDRENFDYSFNKEKITESEFLRRISFSTVTKINNRKKSIFNK